MTGLISFAPVYVNGLLALLFVFVFPGFVFVRGFSIPTLPQRWFVVFLSSLTANHLLVTLIATLHFDPLETYRVAAIMLVVVWVFLIVRGASGSGTPIYPGASVARQSDIVYLLLSLMVLCLTYFNVWKHGVPNIFDDGDVSISWNTWSLIWSQGKFPTLSLGYPQFIPTVWAVTYILTGSTVQYFAFYTYIVLLIVPIVLTAMNLARASWWHALLPGSVFVWFVAEIQEGWLRSTLEQGFPDWVAAVSGFCGVVLFITNVPLGRFSREKIVTALVSLCLVSIAAATKPIYGLFAVAILIAVCIDAAKFLERSDRNRLTVAAVGLVLAFAAAYALNYWHIAARGMPAYPVSELSERLSRAARLLNANFTLPFRMVALAGLVLSPFLPRIRWLTLPLVAGFWLWANKAGYDLRNILGLLLMCAFIPLYVVMRAYVAPKVLLSERRWILPDGAVAVGLAILSVGLTLTLAQSDKALEQRFADEQFRKGPGLDFNQNIERLFANGCTLFTATPYPFTVTAFQRFRDLMQFFFYGQQENDPINVTFLNHLNRTTGCMAILYPPDLTLPSLRSFIVTTAETRGLRKVLEGNGNELLASSP